DEDFGVEVVQGDGEADGGDTLEFEGDQAEDFAQAIANGSAGVSGVDGGIDLVVGGAFDFAIDSAEQAAGDGLGEDFSASARVADGVDALAGLAFAFGQFDGGEGEVVLLEVDFNQ